MKQPDPKLHKYISFTKSTVRIFAGVNLAMGRVVSAGILFVLAEILGIIEEMV